ncbi:MAG TPA: tRNA (adenosine(37)-N6)-dimethylallyltransferase MiaA [Anaerolineaceae bacterium]
MTSSILKISQLSHTNPLVVIVGPTAVGKTEIALRLAERLGAEIISADSRLFYRGMDIGTAKPTLAERARVPHHLVDVADPDETWSLPVFQKAAHEAVCAIHARDRLPLLVGGTGQYLRAVMEGWEVPPQKPDLVLRAALERWAAEVGPYGLHERLAVVDPLAARLIDARNVRRTVRALEVTLRTGLPFSEQRKQSASPYSLLIIGLTRPRAELYQRVDERIQAMLESGFADEVRALLARGYAPDLSTLSAIGYREMVAYIRGEMALDDAVAQMKRLTRRFIRHQVNWFKATDPAIHWFTAGPDTVDEIESLLRSGEGWLPQGWSVE